MMVLGNCMSKVNGGGGDGEVLYASFQLGASNDHHTTVDKVCKRSSVWKIIVLGKFGMFFIFLSFMK